MAISMASLIFTPTTPPHDSGRVFLSFAHAPCSRYYGTLRRELSLTSRSLATTASPLEAVFERLIPLVIMPHQLDTLLATLPHDAPVLDAGGWFKTLPRATHVVDCMPYETRGGRLELGPLAGERFSGDTWHQVNFLQPQLRLPFTDRFFAFSVCSHTLEDLEDPVPLMRELQRVSRAGYIETPSRLSEQTAGIRDRMNSTTGHPHHHWIWESQNGEAVLSHKDDSLRGAWWQTTVPLQLTEQMNLANPSANTWSFAWTTRFRWRQVRGSEARQAAIAFARKSGASRTGLLFDLSIRKLRRFKHRLRFERASATETWWAEMVKLSQPYNRLSSE